MVQEMCTQCPHGISAVSASMTRPIGHDRTSALCTGAGCDFCTVAGVGTLGPLPRRLRAGAGREVGSVAKVGTSDRR